ncbi:RimK family alpha-L-glutamate ligase [Nocardioides sp. GCM10027113]|uniref:ATP-grasp domain-containing protein n=1 Tax=unclassified Nocardioides TaxID=2615069 RepID=UPI00360B7CD3
MPDVLLATFNLMPDGEPGGDHLLTALARRGVDARWERWDDPEVDWAAARLVVVRSTWDYHRRLDEFLAWARHVEKVTTLLNGADVFTWNADKAYLADLGDLPVVPTDLLDDANLLPGLTAALAEHGAVVVKPRTGAGGVGVVVAESLEDQRLEGLTASPWVVQPLVESVRTEGETSVFVLEGHATAQVDKLPAEGEIRVHELYGGGSRPVQLDPEALELAERAVAVVGSRFGEVPAYARVDMMRHDGRLVVSELELIEPGLYLDVIPDNAAAFADLLAARLA